MYMHFICHSIHIAQKGRETKWQFSEAFEQNDHFSECNTTISARPTCPTIHTEPALIPRLIIVHAFTQQCSLWEWIHNNNTYKKVGLIFAINLNKLQLNCSHLSSSPKYICRPTLNHLQVLRANKQGKKLHVRN